MGMLPRQMMSKKGSPSTPFHRQHSFSSKDLLHAYNSLTSRLGYQKNIVQQEVLVRLQDLADSISSRDERRRRWWWPLVGGYREHKMGAYLYGEVGTGKTMIMDIFCREVLPGEPKLRVHFNQFMMHAHARAHQLRKAGVFGNRVMGEVARELAGKHRLICLDEFQVVDIADAMILRTLLESLQAEHVPLLITSNRPPRDLYMGGIQRKSFEPCIRMIEDKFEVLEVGSGKDFRMGASSIGGTYYQRSEGSLEKVEDLFEEISRSDQENLMDGLTLKPPTRSKMIQTIHGRTIDIPKSSKTACWLTYTDLLESARSAADFLAIVENFEVLFVVGLPRFTGRLGVEARRFITFIDIAYDARKRLVVEAECSIDELFGLTENHTRNISEQEILDELNENPEEALNNSSSSLFTGAEERFAAARAVSRLHQMTSRSWWDAHSR